MVARLLRRIARRIKFYIDPRRKQCNAHRTAVLHDESRITNHLGIREAISIGPGSHVRGELITLGHGGKIVIGQDSYFGEDSRIWSAASVVIGDRVLIAHRVDIFDNLTHPIGAAARHAQFLHIVEKGQPRSIDLDERPVSIEDDVWIGCGSIVLRGVTIGTGAIVGAGSVVTKNVAPWTVVAGNPARVIREIPEDERYANNVGNSRATAAQAAG